MSLSSSLLDKLFHHGGAPRANGAGSAAADAALAPAALEAIAPVMPPMAPPAALQGVDVEAVLSNLAARRGDAVNWRTSIVDLLGLLDLDSSPEARRRLARTLDVHAGPDGSAEADVALHRAVMRKLADNGGKVPSSLQG